MNTIAVGPCEPVLSCVTGGTTEAIDLCGGNHSPFGVVTSLDVVAARRAIWGSSVREAMMAENESRGLKNGIRVLDYCSCCCR